VADIDRIARDTAVEEIGPFELMDLIGLDVSHPVGNRVVGFRRSPPAAVCRVRRRFASGLLGRKTGEDYRYRDDDAPDVRPDPPPPPPMLFRCSCTTRTHSQNVAHSVRHRRPAERQWR
jgi:3-hydroxybutyryl-CoA dehydrogenase